MRMPDMPVGMTFKSGRYYLLQWLPGKRQKWHSLSKDYVTALEDFRRLKNELQPEQQIARMRTLKAQLIACCQKARGRAKRNGLDCDISVADLMAMGERAGWRCVLTGIRFEFTGIAGHHCNPFAPSLDRIDSKKGYTKDNVRLVCVAVNYAMNQWGEQVLVKICEGYMNKHRHKSVILDTSHLS